MGVAVEVGFRQQVVLAQDFCLVESYGVGLFGRGLFEVYRRC